MFTLAISYLITSNLPWFMDLTLQIPMQYCSLQHQSLLSPPNTHVSTLTQHLHSFWSSILGAWIQEESPFFSSRILGTYQPGEFIFQSHVILPFHREAKGKGKMERYTHLNASSTGRDKKVFLSEQCKETEENNRMGKTRDLIKKKLEIIREYFMQRCLPKRTEMLWT